MTEVIVAAICCLTILVLAGIGSFLFYMAKLQASGPKTMEAVDALADRVQALETAIKAVRDRLNKKGYREAME